jgi:hypothetical protein
LGGEIQRVEADLDLKVFQQGRIELIEDFPDFDRDGNGRVDDNDLLFAVTLRSGFPDRSLVLPDTNNTYLAGFCSGRLAHSPAVHSEPRFALRDRYRRQERQSRRRAESAHSSVSEGTRSRDKNNFAPRVGFNYSTKMAARVFTPATASTTTA